VVSDLCRAGMTIAERSFFAVLRQAVGDKGPARRRARFAAIGQEGQLVSRSLNPIGDRTTLEPWPTPEGR
jgi:hypothetical protein